MPVSVRNVDADPQRPLQFVMFHASDKADEAARTRIIQAARSVRAHHPEAEVVLLNGAKGVDGSLPAWITVLSRPADTSKVMLERLRWYSDYVREAAANTVVVFFDTDMLLVRRLEPILAAGADLTVTLRESVRHPVNGGLLVADMTRHGIVVQFFERLLAKFETLSPAQQRWGGDQFALKTTLKSPQGPLAAIMLQEEEGLRVRYAPVLRFNNTPTRQMMRICLFRPEARLLHFKGNRKPFMTRYARLYLSPPYLWFARGTDRLARLWQR